MRWMGFRENVNRKPTIFNGKNTMVSGEDFLRFSRLNQSDPNLAYGPMDHFDAHNVNHLDSCLLNRVVLFGHDIIHAVVDPLPCETMSLLGSANPVDSRCYPP